MTATTAKKNTAAATEENVKPEVVENSPAVESVPDDKTPVSRIPEVLSVQSILADFCQRYLDSLDEIAKYNADVLADSKSEWNQSKVMAKARELGSPEDASKAVPAIKKLLDEMEKAQVAYNNSRKALLDSTAKELGITLSATATRDPEVEENLKKKRAEAKVIGTQLSTIADMVSDKEASKAVIDFLSANPLPAIGRDQTHNFGSDSGESTAKYRVTVTISRDGTELASFDGFSKAGLGLTKYYERGKALKADTLRDIWEKAGNSKADPYKVSPVEFTDEDNSNLHFVIAKK